MLTFQHPDGQAEARSSSMFLIQKEELLPCDIAEPSASSRSWFVTKHRLSTVGIYT